MNEGHYVRAPRERRRRRQQPYKLGEFILVYVIALAIVVLVASVNPFAIGASVFVVGLFVSKFVSRRVTWWNQSDNLTNIFRAKVHTVITWPISLPVLIFQIAVVKFL